MVKVHFSALYVINQIKLRRLILGISARELSRLMGVSPHYVAKIESTAQKNSYSHSVLAKVATILNCSVRDLFPPDELLIKNDGSNVFKEVISLSHIEIATEVVYGMIDIGYFDGSRLDEETTSNGITKYLDVLGKKEAPIVQQALDNAVANGKLTLTNGSYIQP